MVTAATDLEAQESGEREAAGPRPRGTRLEQLERTFKSRVEELDGVRREIERLVRTEDETLAETVRAAPTQRAYRLGSGPWKLRDRRAKLQKKVEPLEREVDELGRVLGEERSREAEATLERLVREATALTRQELDGWREAGELLERLLAVWLDLILPAAEARDRIYLDARGLLGLLGKDAEQQLSRATGQTVGLWPSTFPQFVSRVVEVATDPRRLGVRDLAREQPLVAVIPDLRGRDRRANLSGRVERATS